VTLFPSVLCSPPPVYTNSRTPPIDSREVPFPKCAFRQSPHKNNIDIACENKNQTSLCFPYLSFCQVLDSYSVISYIRYSLYHSPCRRPMVSVPLSPGRMHIHSDRGIRTMEQLLATMVSIPTSPLPVGQTTVIFII
jgi:hypothetical protein